MTGSQVGGPWSAGTRRYVWFASWRELLGEQPGLSNAGLARGRSARPSIKSR